VYIIGSIPSLRKKLRPAKVTIYRYAEQTTTSCLEMFIRRFNCDAKAVENKNSNGHKAGTLLIAAVLT